MSEDSIAFYREVKKYIKGAREQSEEGYIISTEYLLGLARIAAQRCSDKKGSQSSLELEVEAEEERLMRNARINASLYAKTAKQFKSIPTNRNSILML